MLKALNGLLCADVPLTNYSRSLSHANSPGNTAYCYTELALSSLAEM